MIFCPFKVSDLLPVLEWVPKIHDAIYRKLKLKGQIQTLDLKLNTPVDSVLDPDTLMNSAHATLTLKGNKLSLIQYGNTFSASTLDTNVRWKDRQWTHTMVLDMLGGQVESQAQMVFKKGPNKVDDWKLESERSQARIDPHRLLQFANHANRLHFSPLDVRQQAVGNVLKVN